MCAWVGLAVSVCNGEGKGEAKTAPGARIEGIRSQHSDPAAGWVRGTGRGVARVRAVGQSNRKGYGWSESAAQRRRASTSAVSIILNRQRAIKARVWRQARGIFSAHGAPVHPGMGGEKEEERMAPPTAGRSDLAGGVWGVRSVPRSASDMYVWAGQPAADARRRSGAGCSSARSLGHRHRLAATMAGSPRVLQAWVG